ncbi:MAG TPA: DUF2817 domain-containing protein [Candidatus Saccharimonadales bacterium]|nr:DUF2817 domain-containing protein [Candidatus Saccharimonadales bacterium]
MKNLHHRVKKHYHYHKRFLPHYFFITAATVAFVFGFYSLFPAKVSAQKEEVQSIDQPIEVTIWGSLDKNSLEVVSNYDTPLSARVETGLYPFKHVLQITPGDLLYPDATYKFTVKTKNWFGIAGERHIEITTESLPKASLITKIPSSGRVAVDTALQFQIDHSLAENSLVFSSEPKFAFEEKLEGKTLTIKPKGKLQQGANYKIALILNTKLISPNQIYAGSIAIIDPLVIVSSSPANNQTLVPKQTVPAFVFNKAVVQETLAKALKVEPSFAYTPTWKDEKTLELTPSSTLQTNTTYKVTFADNLEGTDGSQLASDEVVTFTTAGAVKVTSFSPSGNSVSSASSVSVSFDQSVDHNSAQAAFSLSPAVGGSFSWSANTMIFKPASLGMLVTYTTTIAKGVKSIGGSDSSQAFSSSFTTTSERSKTIGYSVKNRAIVATYFGVGPKKILLIATMHGNEGNTGNMLTSWISYLRANQTQIGSDRTFVIVAFANPDGKASNNRFNANGVDLNRNFDLPDWQSVSYWQNRSYPNGAGSAPFSEPESRALRDLVYSEGPMISISYHSNANMILGDGIAQALGDWYASQTGYTRVQSNGEESDVSALGYVITGTYEEWATRRGVKTLVVEFISQTANEYNRNLPALKGLLSYPI